MRVALGVLLGVWVGVRVADLLWLDVPIAVDVANAVSVDEAEAEAVKLEETDSDDVAEADSDARAERESELGAVAKAEAEVVTVDVPTGEAVPVAIALGVAWLEDVPPPRLPADADAQLVEDADSDSLVVTLVLAVEELVSDTRTRALGDEVADADGVTVA